MGEHGAALQKFNQELVKCLEGIKVKRSELCEEIEKEDKTRIKLETEIAQLQSELDKVSSSLRKKVLLKENYDRAIKESEHAYMKILESSQILLNMVKKESEVLFLENEHG